MALLRHHMKRLWMVLPAVSIVLFLMLLASGAFAEQGEQDAVHLALANIEVYAFFISALFCCFLLHNRDETECAVIYGTNPARLLFCQYAPVLIYSYLPAIAFSLILFDVSMWLRLFLSYGVTLFFITSLTLLGRLALNNTYASTGILMFFYILFFVSTNERIYKMVIPIENARFDPYITNYLHIRRNLENGTIWVVSPGVWERNRLMFAGLGFVILLACGLLVKRERLYQK